MFSVSTANNGPRDDLQSNIGGRPLERKRPRTNARYLSPLPRLSSRAGGGETTRESAARYALNAMRTRGGKRKVRKEAHPARKCHCAQVAVRAARCEDECSPSGHGRCCQASPARSMAF
eukprot:9487565-Pyramimonas_sp.AAC.1